MTVSTAVIVDTIRLLIRYRNSFGLLEDRGEMLEGDPVGMNVRREPEHVMRRRATP